MIYYIIVEKSRPVRHHTSKGCPCPAIQFVNYFLLPFYLTRFATAQAEMTGNANKSGQYYSTTICNELAFQLPVRAKLGHGQADGAVATGVDLVAEPVPRVGGSGAEVGIVVVVVDRPPVVVVVAELGLLPVVVHRPVVLGRETIVVVVLVPEVVVLVPEVIVVLVPEVIVVLSPVGEIIEHDVLQIFSLCFILFYKDIQINL